MGRRRLAKTVGGPVVGMTALAMLGVSAAPAGAATETATYRRSDLFTVQDPEGTVTCRINGQVTTYDDDTVFVYVGRDHVEGETDACYEGYVHIVVTYDPDPSDAATSTFTVVGSGNEVSAGRVLAPNFIESRHTVSWQYDDREPAQTAGPYRLPNSK